MAGTRRPAPAAVWQVNGATADAQAAWCSRWRLLARQRHLPLTPGAATHVTRVTSVTVAVTRVMVAATRGTCVIRVTVAVTRVTRVTRVTAAAATAETVNESGTAKAGRAAMRGTATGSACTTRGRAGAHEAAMTMREGSAARRVGEQVSRRGVPAVEAAAACLGLGQALGRGLVGCGMRVATCMTCVTCCVTAVAAVASGLTAHLMLAAQVPGMPGVGHRRPLAVVGAGRASVALAGVAAGVARVGRSVEPRMPFPCALFEWCPLRNHHLLLLTACPMGLHCRNGCVFSAH